MSSIRQLTLADTRQDLLVTVEISKRMTTSVKPKENWPAVGVSVHISVGAGCKDPDPEVRIWDCHDPVTAYWDGLDRISGQAVGS